MIYFKIPPTPKVHVGRTPPTLRHAHSLTSCSGDISRDQFVTSYANYIVVGRKEREIERVLSSL